DIINVLAGIAANDPLDALRDHRPQAKENAQLSFEALLEPSDPAGFSYLERYAVAAFTAGLLGALPPRSSTATCCAMRTSPPPGRSPNSSTRPWRHPFRTPAPEFRARTGSSNPRHWPERMRPARGSPRRRNRQRL